MRSCFLPLALQRRHFSECCVFICYIFYFLQRICNYFRISDGPVHPAWLLRGKPVSFCSLTPNGGHSHPCKSQADFIYGLRTVHTASCQGCQLTHPPRSAWARSLSSIPISVHFPFPLASCRLFAVSSKLLPPASSSPTPLTPGLAGPGGPRSILFCSVTFPCGSTWGNSGACALEYADLQTAAKDPACPRDTRLPGPFSTLSHPTRAGTPHILFPCV